ncbi:site-specific recombinase XerD [Brevibacillus aydinogluensis]|jgi:site-specific recombinase XerD|uniref:tyrosine-type recombinase/integrase n=1 Tax=Brevibacillus aydinogluensis TaxID=927786 RepID=UPI0028930A3A|nr:tyrosine-type recombinase/integrase [Brevibacillus aydinogluensis]MDT3418248.1 site-specific recombinase XerD [Brevibacillus aydinogluensis]
MKVLTITKADQNEKYVREFLRFLKSDKGCSDNTITAYEKDLKQFIAHFPNKDILEDLRESDIRDYKVSLTEKGNAPRTINRSLSVIRSFYHHFVNHDDWDIRRSPARNVKQMKVPKTIPITLHESEAELLLDGILLFGRYARRDYAIFATFLFTGMRVSELIQLSIGDIDFDNEVIMIRQGKGSKDRQVPMIPRLAEALKYFIDTGTTFAVDTQERKRKGKGIVKVDLSKCGRSHFSNDVEEQTLFLTKYGKPFTEKGIDYLFKHYTKLFGIQRKGLSLHAMRRSCLTFLYRQGVDLFTLKEISGHAKIQTLEHYLVIDPGKVKVAASKHPLASTGLDHRLVSLLKKRWEGEAYDK